MGDLENHTVDLEMRDKEDQKDRVDRKDKVAQKDKVDKADKKMLTTTNLETDQIDMKKDRTIMTEKEDTQEQEEAMQEGTIMIETKGQITPGMMKDHLKGEKEVMKEKREEVMTDKTEEPDNLELENTETKTND